MVWYGMVWYGIVCIYVSMYLCIYVSMYLCIYVCMYVCMYVYIYIYIHIHIHIYICLKSSGLRGFWAIWRPVKSTETFYTQDSIYPLYCVDTADAWKMPLLVSQPVFSQKCGNTFSSLLQECCMFWKDYRPYFPHIALKLNTPIFQRNIQFLNGRPHC